MTVLTLQQVAAYARAAGFTGDALVNMTAVATPESSLRTDAVNGSSGAVGIWQINQPVHVKDHPTWTRAWLSDPQNNASAAKVIYDAQGMGAWEAWTSGAAAPYMAAARTAAASVGGAPATSATADPASWWLPDWNPDHYIEKDGSGSSGGVAGTLGSIGDGLVGLTTIAKLIGQGALWAAAPKNWNRLMWVVIGGGMILIGLEKTGVPVASTIGKVRKVTKTVTP